MKRPITVLMPVFNGERHLAESIRSVLVQTFRDFELIVVDDGSTDGSASVAESFGDDRVRVIRNTRNEGLVAALNRGLHEARGEWIARQDADDWSAPGRLAAQLDFVRSHPAIPLLGSDARLVGDGGKYLGRWRTGGHADLVRWDLCFRTPFAHSSAFFRRSLVVERFGGYRDLRASEDFDLWSRVGREFPVVTLRQSLVRYRLHADSIMAAENAKGAAVPVAGIIRENLVGAAPGLAAVARDVIAEVWTGNPAASWSDYFRAIGELTAGFLRGRREPPGFGKLLAEQHYTLLCRQPDPAAKNLFLNNLRSASFPQFVRLPWVRVAAAMIAR